MSVAPRAMTTAPPSAGAATPSTAMTSPSTPTDLCLHRRRVRSACRATTSHTPRCCMAPARRSLPKRYEQKHHQRELVMLLEDVRANNYNGRESADRWPRRRAPSSTCCSSVGTNAACGARDRRRPTAVAAVRLCAARRQSTLRTVHVEPPLPVVMPAPQHEKKPSSNW